MEPYKAKKLPYEINIPSDILNLLCEAKEAYGEYKGYLKNMSYDYKCFLENAFVNDIFYSYFIYYNGYSFYILCIYFIKDNIIY